MLWDPVPRLVTLALSRRGNMAAAMPWPQSWSSQLKAYPLRLQSKGELTLDLGLEVSGWDDSLPQELGF